VKQCRIPDEDFCSIGGKSKGFGKKKNEQGYFSIIHPNKSHRDYVHFLATLTEGFPCLFLSCKANARVKLAKTGHGQHFPIYFPILSL
jgi:hypothetical protein